MLLNFILVTPLRRFYKAIHLLIFLTINVTPFTEKCLSTFSFFFVFLSHPFICLSFPKVFLYHYFISYSWTLQCPYVATLKWKLINALIFPLPKLQVSIFFFFFFYKPTGGFFYPIVTKVMLQALKKKMYIFVRKGNKNSAFILTLDS